MRLRIAGIAAAAALLIGLAAPPAQAAPLATSSKLHLTLTSSAKPVAADWIALKGSVTSAYGSKKFSVDRRAGTGQWKSVLTTKASKAGAVSFRTRATGVGKYSYRISIVPKKHAARISSNAVSLTVFRWYYLSDIQSAGSDSMSRGPVTMAGTTYFHSILLNGQTQPHYGDFNASYKCSTFQSTIGISDATQGTATAAFSLLADSTDIADASVTLGKTAPMQADVTGVFRVRLQTGFVFSKGGNAGWGDARLLCSGAPAPAY